MAGGGLVGQPAGRIALQPWAPAVEEARADVGDERCVKSGELGRRGRLGETDDRVVRLVNPQHDGDIVVGVVDGAAEVVDACAVGRADLDEVGAGPGHHVGDTETAADLDQFAAAYDYVPAFGKTSETEQNGSGAVVDDDGVLGAAGLGDQRAGGGHARTALAGGEVEFEVGVALGLLPRHRRPPEVGVQDRAGCVDDGAQHPPARGNCDRPGGIRGAGCNRGTRRVDQHRVRKTDVRDRPCQLVDGRWTIGRGAHRWQLRALVPAGTQARLGAPE